jgi:Tol biopolymer transport system component
LNSTSQLFVAKGNQKVEVYDTKSDLVLYDVDTEETRYIVRDSLSLETFPYWSADGKTLFYASAYLPDFGADLSTDLSMITEKIRYNIWSVGFNPQTKEFGTPTLVFDAESDSLSAVTPRPSPDGRYLLSGVGRYGSFHVWHESGDIYLTDLETGVTHPLNEINSPRAESFKSWSSNSRWIAFTSRRDDGSYTRIYLAYFDAEGNAHKPFLLPQRDPDQNHRLFKSYNVPEFTTDKSSWTPKRIEMIVHSDLHHATLIK